MLRVMLCRGAGNRNEGITRGVVEMRTYAGSGMSMRSQHGRVIQERSAGVGEGRRYGRADRWE